MSLAILGKDLEGKVYYGKRAKRPLKEDLSFVTEYHKNVPVQCHEDQESGTGAFKCAFQIAVCQGSQPPDGGIIIEKIQENSGSVARLNLTPLTYQEVYNLGGTWEDCDWHSKYYIKGSLRGNTTNRSGKTKDYAFTLYLSHFERHGVQLPSEYAHLTNHAIKPFKYEQILSINRGNVPGSSSSNGHFAPHSQQQPSQQQPSQQQPSPQFPPTLPSIDSITQQHLQSNYYPTFSEAQALHTLPGQSFLLAPPNRHTSAAPPTSLLDYKGSLGPSHSFIP